MNEGEQGMLAKLAARLGRIKNVLIPTGILLGGLLVVQCFYLMAVQPATEQLATVQTFGLRQEGAFSSSLENGQQLQQAFFVEGPQWSGFGFYVGTYRQTLEEITFTGEIVDPETGEILARFSEYLPQVEDNQKVEVLFLKPLETNGQEVLLRFWLESTNSERVAVLLAEGGELSPFVVNEERQEGAMVLEVFSTSEFLTSYYYWVALPLVGLLVLLWLLVFVFQWRWKNIFLAAALGLGVLYIFVYPPYSMLDDDAHIPLTYYHSSRLLYGETASNGSFQNRAEDSMMGYTKGSPGRGQLYHTQKGLLAEEKAPGETVSTSVIVLGQAYQYFPQMLGVSLGRLWGLGQVGTLHLGRLLALLAYVGILYFTLHIAPQKVKPMFTLLGLLPFVLHTAGSFSYDISIISLSFLFIGYVLHIAYDKEKISIVDAIVLAVVGLLLAPLKFVYMPILLTVFLIPGKKWPRPWVKLLFGGVLVLAGAAFLLHYVNTYYGPGSSLMTAEVGMTPWNDPEGGHTYGSLLAQPAELARLLFFSVFDRMDELIRAVGYFQYNGLPLWLCVMIWVGVFVSLIPVKGESTLLLAPWQKALMAASSGSIYLLCMVAALPWTYIGSYYIRGVQGRYFIAFFPLVAMLFCGGRLLQRKKDNSRTLVYGLLLINAYGILSLLLSAMNNRLPTTRL